MADTDNNPDFIYIPAGPFDPATWLARGHVASIADIVEDRIISVTTIDQDDAYEFSYKNDDDDETVDEARRSVILHAFGIEAPPLPPEE